jgi:hypothetical protein
MDKDSILFSEILIYLNNVGEPFDQNEWVLVDARVDDNETEEEDFEAMLNSTMTVAMSSGAPQDTRSKDSVQDSKWIKVRYSYVQGSRKYGSSITLKQRPFCRAMEAARKIYRKEDILKMKDDGVNSEFGHQKQPYSLWLHKGGVNCYHKFERRVYVKREKVDGTPWGGSAMNGVKKATQKEARVKGFNKDKGIFRNDKRVAEAQIDRSDKGHHPSYRGPKKTKK